VTAAGRRPTVTRSTVTERLFRLTNRHYERMVFAAFDPILPIASSAVLVSNLVAAPA